MHVLLLRQDIKERRIRIRTVKRARPAYRLILIRSSANMVNIIKHSDSDR